MYCQIDDGSGEASGSMIGQIAEEDTDGHVEANGNIVEEDGADQGGDDEFVSMREMRIYVVEAKGESQSS